MTRSLVKRRNDIARAQDVASAEAAKVIAKLLKQRFTKLKRQLQSARFQRKATHDHLGKRLTANGGKLTKADPEFEDWQQWVDAFTDALEAAFDPVVQAVYAADSKWWLSQNARPAPVDPKAIMRAYQSRTGRQIKNIAEDTRDNVLKDITTWYNTDASFKSLIQTLSQYFNESRAETIARTESSQITSEVASNLYGQMGVEYWNWDLGSNKGEWPCEDCRAQAEINPHTSGDMKPPQHPRCRCGTVPATKSGDVFIYGKNT